MTGIGRVLRSLLTAAIASAALQAASPRPVAAEARVDNQPLVALRLAQTTHGPDSSSRRPPGATSLPAKPRGLVCIGGRVAGGRCVCAFATAVSTAPGIYVCRTPPREPGGASGGGAVACKGGRVEGGRCLCPSGTVWRSGVCRDSPLREPPGGAVRDDGGRPGSQPERGPQRASPDRSPPKNPVLPPPSGPPRIAPGPAPRPDALALSAADATVPAEVVATLPSSAPTSLEDDVARALNLQLVERLDVALTAERLVRFRIPDARTVDAVVTALGGDARLTGPQPSVVYRNQGGGGAAPADLQYAVAKVELPAAHLMARGDGAVVAVIDSGVDRRHPDLAGVVDDEIDVSGAPAGAAEVADPHGTAIAGIIAARGLVKGVAPLARVFSIKAFRPPAAGAASVSTTAMLVAGIDKAVGRGARILNMSFAGSEDAIVHRLVKAAAGKGVLMVAAAGNKGPGAPPAYPAAYPEVVAVTATDASDRLYAKANRGGYVAVAAPGVDVLAPGAARSHQLQSGTSFAAAHVSGVLALLVERKPRITAPEAREALVASAVDLGPPGPDEEFGAGRLSAAAALRLVGGLP
jgi:hypothetical protein